jgi:hypothetical protein
MRKKNSEKCKDKEGRRGRGEREKCKYKGRLGRVENKKRIKTRKEV